VKITQAKVRRLFDYRDGNLIWKVSRGRAVAGAIAGSLNPGSDGYVRVMIDRLSYRAHRLIYLWHHGHCPPLVDHKDTNRSNNRIENLRPRTNKQNCRNRAGANISNVSTGLRNIHRKKDRYHVNVFARYRGSFINLCDALKCAKELRHAV